MAKPSRPSAEDQRAKAVKAIVDHLTQNCTTLETATTIEDLIFDVDVAVTRDSASAIIQDLVAQKVVVEHGIASGKRRAGIAPVKYYVTKVIQVSAIVTGGPAVDPVVPALPAPVVSKEQDEVRRSQMARVQSALERTEKSVFFDEPRPRKPAWVAAEMMYSPFAPGPLLCQELLELLVQAGRVTAFMLDGARHYLTASAIPEWIHYKSQNRNKEETTCKDASLESTQASPVASS